MKRRWKTVDELNQERRERTLMGQLMEESELEKIQIRQERLVLRQHDNAENIINRQKVMVRYIK